MWNLILHANVEPDNPMQTRNPMQNNLGKEHSVAARNNKTNFKGQNPCQTNQTSQSNSRQDIDTQ